MQQPLLRPRGSRRRVPYVVLLLCLAATAAATAFVSVSAGRRDRARFDRTAERTRVAIANRMDAYAASLRNMTALFQTGGIPSRQQFAEYVGRLDLPRHYPGLRGIGFSVRFAAGDRETIARTGRDHIDPSFRLWPGDPPRDEYHAVFYLEPTDEQNRRAIGFDMHSEPVRAAAMDGARDAGAPMASGKVELVGPADGQPRQTGFLVYMPLYKGKQTPPSVEERREKLIGYVYAPFHADDFLRGTFHGDPHADVDFFLYDGTAAEPARLLHDSSAFRPAAGAHRPRHAKLDRIEVAGRAWTVRFVTRPEFEQGSTRWLVPSVLAAGVLVSLTVFAMTRSQLAALLAAREALARLQQSEADLRLAKETAEAANSAKDDFLATLSHELRTPLNAILGWSHLLRSGDAGAGDLAEGLAVIEQNARAQSRLVGDLLDVSSIVNGTLRLDLRPVRLAAVVESALESAGQAAQAKRVRVEKLLDAEAGVVAGDATRLQQVVWNLLNNAIKFTPEGGRVRVTLRRAGSHAEIAVSDTGIGIRPEFVPRAFERFQQEDATATRRHGGLGIGLAIVKQVVDLHGGTVRAESPGEGAGSTFTVSLPLAVTPRDVDDAAVHAPADGTDQPGEPSGPSPALSPAAPHP